MPTETAGHVGSPQINREMLTIHRVFERFVASFLRIHLSGWEVTRQKPLSWHAPEKSPYLPSMYADLLLRHNRTGQLIILDTKFTPHSLVVGYGSERFDSNHLYQIYAYLRSQEHLSDHHGAAEGVLLYPTVAVHLSERVVLQAHPIRFETVDLAQPWPDIETRLVAASIGGAHDVR